jgi:pyridoxal phosphate enzyme (YggS family)
VKTIDTATIKHNIAELQQRIGAAARRAGRDQESITMIAVTKTIGVQLIEAAYGLGIRDFGENRVQEMRAKVEAMAADENLDPGLRQRAIAGPGSGGVRWHLIGHLQRNKAKVALSLFDQIQSIDSLELAETVNRLALNSGRLAPVLLEVNISQEPSKYGFNVNSLWTVFESLYGLPALDVRGLMTVAPFVDDPEQVRTVFRAVRQLRDDLEQRFPGASLPELSMGMTDDFEVAIEEGATIIRIGRALFGQRPTSSP